MADLELESSKENLPKPAILILDQDDQTRAALLDVIRSITPDARLFEVNSIRDALSKCKNQRFNLLISDTRVEAMAGATATSFVSKIPQENSPPAVYVISATVDEFELMSDLPTATLLGFPLDRAIFEKNYRELFKIPVPAPKASPKKGGFDIAFINPFLDETLKIVKTFAKTDAKRESLFLRTPGQPSGDISGVMAIKSPTFNGSFSVSFDENCFCAIASTMMNTKVTAIGPANQDIAGEVCNQIMGNAKKSLNAMGHTILQTVPKISTGKAHSVQHEVTGPCVAVKFSTAAGNFQIEAILLPAT
jgi:chemotaxis protein CheX